MNAKEYEELLSDVETRLDRLRALYEQYFQGIERLEPTVPKKEVERRMQLLRRSQPRNTALRFRTQQVIQKYTTYLTYWTRVARQIEEGTFRRDVLKARQRREEARAARRAERESVAPAGWEIDLDAREEIEAPAPSARKSAPPVTPIALPKTPVPSQGKSIRPALSPFAVPKSRPSERPGKPAAAATFGKPRDPIAPRPQASPPHPPPPPRPSDGVDIRGVYAKYVEARRRNNERTDNVRYESIERSIKEMLPKLREKHRGKQIDFEVVVRDGKVGLKPVAK